MPDMIKTPSYPGDSASLSKGGENVLFVGNSLTASLSETLNEAAQANGLPTFNGHRVQLWNETFATHVLLSPELTPNKFDQGENAGPGMDGYAVKAAFNSLWKKGQYDVPEFVEKGYITALDAIKHGTPEGEPWDVVVLQGYGDANKPENEISVAPDGTITASGAFMIHGSALIEAAKTVGAEPVLYMAWLLNPEKGGGNEDPESFYNKRFDSLIANYNALAEAHGIRIVPVGEAMRFLSAEGRTDAARVAWLIRDSVHPTACGSALLIYSMAGALYGKPATELQYRRDAGGSGWKRIYHYVVGETESKYDLLVTPEVDSAIKQAAQRFNEAYGW